MNLNETSASGGLARAEGMQKKSPGLELRARMAWIAASALRHEANWGRAAAALNLLRGLKRDPNPHVRRTAAIPRLGADNPKEAA